MEIKPDDIKILKQATFPPGEPVLLCLCRNEELTISAIVDHHRRLGFSCFVFLDNGSDDRTQDILAELDGVTLLESKLPYKHYQNVFKKYLYETYAMDRWGLLVDADEFFDYPGSDRLSIQGLIRYLDDHGYNSMFTPLLDMYSDKPLIQLPEIDGPGFRTENYSFCELDSIHRPWKRRLLAKLVNRSFEVYEGGIRRSHFGVGCWLNKFVFLKSSAGHTPYHSPHAISHRSKVADVSGVLFHYKFTSAFFGKVKSALDEGQYFQNSSEYHQYAKILSEKPDFSLMTKKTKSFTDFNLLLNTGFAYASKHFHRHLTETSTA